MAQTNVTKAICGNGGAMDYNDLVYKILLGNESSVQRSYIFPTANGKKLVIAKTKVRLCKAINCEGCNNLHLCKFFLFGGRYRCRRPCRYGHNLNTEHNARVLSENDLQDLDKSELCTLLLQNDTNLLPPVCFSYNKGNGEYGNCPGQESCWRLHICDRYLRGTCPSGTDCLRSHDLLEPHPQKALQEKGIPSLLIGSLLSVYRNIQVMKGADGGGAGYRGQAPGRSANGTGTGPEKTEICMYFIRGSCRHEDKCWKVHSKLPYVWEVKAESGWLGLPDNEQLEKEFCDPANDCSQGFPGVNFGTMTRGSAQVRRLSTVSSVLQPNFVLTTEWAWYWQDEHGKWIQYSSSAGGHDASSVGSEELERKYQEDHSAIVPFNAGAQSYRISIKDMVQTNVQYGTRRAVRRRPVFVSSAEAQTIKTRKKLPAAGTSNFKALPSHWDKSLVPETGFKRISLQLNSDECRQIVTLFEKTMRGFRIQQIERVQNKALWEVFQWQKDLMRKRNAGRNVTEKQLFHGTDTRYVDAICQQNFDWRICGTHGTAYGKGSYFARDAKYSHSYTGSSGMRTMFVCRVLVGCYTKGDPSYLRPPSKDGGDSVFYDSCVDEIHNPSIFVVFEKHQVYPEYIIKYSGNEWDSPVHSYAPPNPQPVYNSSQWPPQTNRYSSTQPNSGANSRFSNTNSDSYCVIS